MWLIEAFDGFEALEAASLEDVGFVVLDYVRRNYHQQRHFHGGNLARRNDASSSLVPGSAQLTGVTAAKVEAIIIEAVGWLAAERLIAADHTSNSDGYYIVTRLGNRIQSSSAMSSYAKRAYLPHQVLREDISEVALAPFLAGRYDEAVRAAFTRLETKIREAAGYGHDRYGVAMVRDAFSPGKRDGSEVGPLADPELEYSEREAVAHLLAGAIGYIKNPLSHRELNIDDARLAASRILLANDLMNTVVAHIEKRRRPQ